MLDLLSFYLNLEKEKDWYHFKDQRFSKSLQDIIFAPLHHQLSDDS